MVLRSSGTMDQSKVQTGESGLILEPLIIANATGITLAANGLGCLFFLVLLLRAAGVPAAPIFSAGALWGWALDPRDIT